jgi:hypothetical protein
MSAPLPPPVAGERRIAVGELTRVEGEGSLRLVVRDGKVVEARLGIFEAPRYFEQLVLGRSPDEVIDIVARICGICPVAYQMSAVHAFEDCFGVRIDPAVRALRRLMYCGEWIESLGLHVYMLHAPDFLGYDSAIAMARDHRQTVERGLALKKSGNDLIRVLGGRAIHPVSVKVGFYRTRAGPSRGDAARRWSTRWSAKATVRWTTGFAMPAFPRDMRFVAMRIRASIRSTTAGLCPTTARPAARLTRAFEEFRSKGPTRCTRGRRTARGRISGPAAGSLCADQLHPVARALLEETGMQEMIRTNIYASIVARAVELVHATAERWTSSTRTGLRLAGGRVAPRRCRPGDRGAARAVLHRYETDSWAASCAARSCRRRRRTGRRSKRSRPRRRRRAAPADVEATHAWNR